MTAKGLREPASDVFLQAWIRILVWSGTVTIFTIVKNTMILGDSSKRKDNNFDSSKRY